MNVDDFDGTVQFFANLLEAEEVGGWDRGPNDRGALLQCCSGGVIEVVGHGADFGHPSYAHDALALQVDTPIEVDAFFERCTRTTVVAKPPSQQSWGHYSASARGPLGLEVVIFCERPLRCELERLPA